MPQPKKLCECELEEMAPRRVTFDEPYTHVCDECNGGITKEDNDQYNRVNQFSGYDDADERDFDDEDQD